MSSRNPKGRTTIEVGADGVAVITIFNPPVNSLSLDGTRNSLPVNFRSRRLICISCFSFFQFWCELLEIMSNSPPKIVTLLCLWFIFWVIPEFGLAYCRRVFNLLLSLCCCIVAVIWTSHRFMIMNSHVCLDKIGTSSLTLAKKFDGNVSNFLAHLRWPLDYGRLLGAKTSYWIGMAEG